MPELEVKDERTVKQILLFFFIFIFHLRSSFSISMRRLTGAYSLQKLGYSHNSRFILRSSNMLRAYVDPCMSRI